MYHKTLPAFNKQGSLFITLNFVAQRKIDMSALIKFHHGYCIHEKNMWSLFFETPHYVQLNKRGYILIFKVEQGGIIILQHWLLPRTSSEETTDLIDLYDKQGIPDTYSNTSPRGRVYW